MAKNVFVLGLMDYQRHDLDTIRHADEYVFHDLVGYARLVDLEHFHFRELLEQARAELDAFDGSIDAIIAHWDFPTSVLAPILAHERGLPAPSLTSVLKCEHKYWSRLEQAASVPEYVPAFSSFDPFSDDVCSDIGMDFPFWVKPVKAHSSHLGFRIDNADRLDEAVRDIREDIHDVGDAFDEVLHMVDLPPEIHDAPGTSCLAEEIMTGLQTAPEGSMFRGRFDVHGVFDMHKDERGESISAIDYPASAVPPAVQDKTIEIAERYLRHVNFDNGCFNVEYLWNPDNDELRIIEVNPRISQSHSDLFTKVDGMSNHEIAVDIALGQQPTLPHGAGSYAVAAKCAILHRDDAVVTKVPTEEEIAAVAERFPETQVRLKVAPGDRLSDLRNQDAYNYVLGDIYIGADDSTELEHRRLQCLDALQFDFAPGLGESPAHEPGDDRETMLS